MLLTYPNWQFRPNAVCLSLGSSVCLRAGEIVLRKRKGAFHTCLKRHLVPTCFQAVVRPHTTQVTDVPRAFNETCAEPADAHEFRIEFMNTQAARGLTGRSKPVACGPRCMLLRAVHPGGLREALRMLEWQPACEALGLMESWLGWADCLMAPGEDSFAPYVFHFATDEEACELVVFLVSYCYAGRVFSSMRIPFASQRGRWRAPLLQERSLSVGCRR